MARLTDIVLGSALEALPRSDYQPKSKFMRSLDLDKVVCPESLENMAPVSKSVLEVSVVDV